MKKNILIVGLFSFTVFVGCQSNAERAIDKAEELSKEYINNLNNAKTKEEVQKIRKEHKERVSFEIRKIMGASSEKEAEQKLKDSETDLKWEDIQRTKRIGEEIKRAEKKAIERTHQ